MANGPTVSLENQRAINALRVARQRSGGGLPAGAPQIGGPQLAAPTQPVAPSMGMPAGAQAFLQQIEQDGQRQIQELTSMEQAAQADMDRQAAEDRERYRRMYDTEIEQETRFLTEEQAQERDERARRQRSRATPEGDRGDQEILQAQREKFREEFEPRHSGGRLVSTEVRDPRTRGERSNALRAASARQRSRAGVTEEEEARDLGYAGVGDFLGDGPEDLDAVITGALGEATADEETNILLGDNPDTERLDTLATERERAARIARRNRGRNRNRSGAGSSPADAPAAAAETAAPAAASGTPTRDVGPMREGYESGAGASLGPLRDGYASVATPGTKDTRRRAEMRQASRLSTKRGREASRANPDAGFRERAARQAEEQQIRNRERARSDREAGRSEFGARFRNAPMSRFVRDTLFGGR